MVPKPFPGIPENPAIEGNVHILLLWGVYKSRAMWNESACGRFTTMYGFFFFYNVPMYLLTHDAY